MSPGDAVAQVAHELLDPGPMGWDTRRPDYIEFCERNFVDGASVKVAGSGGTNCAIFARGCLVQADVKQRAGRPVVTGITSWLGVSWFGVDWVPVTKIISGEESLLPGDILYWCGGRSPVWNSTWKIATNGHVGIVLFDGKGWDHQTAEGGGPRHLCRKSDGQKDVRFSHDRPLRGVWRPLLMVVNHRITPK